MSDAGATLASPPGAAARESLTTVDAAVDAGALLASEPVVASPPGGKLPESGKLTGVAEVRVGSFIEAHAGCVRFTDGRVACWAGPNLLHEFGRGRTQPTPGPNPIAGIDDATSLSIGGGQHCARLRRGGVTCWTEDGPPGAVLPDVIEIEPAGDHMCALKKDGTVHCMGKNYNGELGYEPKDPSASYDWRPVPGATRIAHIQGGAGACGLRADGTLYCWGNHPFRAPAKTREEFLADSKPAAITSVRGVRRMLLRGMPCLVLDQDVRCSRDWDGSKKLVLSPVPLGVAVADIVDIDASGYVVCAVARSGKVNCWGPIGRPYSMDAGDWQKMVDAGYKKARTIPGIADAVQISVSDMYSCVTTRSGHARCWGDNEYGELGDGTLSKPASPANPTWVSWFHPALMPGPGEGAFGCHPTPDVQRSCQAAGKDCGLEPPPAYWNFGHGGGVHCDKDCLDREMAEVKKRPVPDCMCNCSPAYQQLENTENDRRSNERQRP